MSGYFLNENFITPIEKSEAPIVAKKSKWNNQEKTLARTFNFKKRKHAEKNVPALLVRLKPVHLHHCLEYSFGFVEVPNPQTDSFVQKTTALRAIEANPSNKIPACA